MKPEPNSGMPDIGRTSISDALRLISDSSNYYSDKNLRQAYVDLAEYLGLPNELKEKNLKENVRYWLILLNFGVEPKESLNEYNLLRKSPDLDFLRSPEGELSFFEFVELCFAAVIQIYGEEYQNQAPHVAAQYEKLKPGEPNGQLRALMLEINYSTVRKTQYERYGEQLIKIAGSITDSVMRDRIPSESQALLLQSVYKSSTTFNLFSNSSINPFLLDLPDELTGGGTNLTDLDSVIQPRRPQEERNLPEGMFPPSSSFTWWM